MLFIDRERAKEQRIYYKARHELRKTLYERETVSTVANSTVKAIQNIYVGF